jgi:hypothetical protein
MEEVSQGWVRGWLMVSQTPRLAFTGRVVDPLPDADAIEVVPQRPVRWSPQGVAQAFFTAAHRAGPKFSGRWRRRSPGS